MSHQASALTGRNGERVALSEVNVSAVLQDLLAEISVCQTYRNDESVNIEAVYTFPLPLDAVLLDLDVDIGGRVFRGAVVEKAAAEGAYEDAMQAGDAAVMLEELEPGLYTMNVGNLLPGESAKITFRYAMLYRWSGDRLRLLLPTTVAPRYGDSPHQVQQASEHSLTVENEFSLSLEVLGVLRDAQFVCPSHAVTLQRLPQSSILSLTQRKAVMDRDFVLNVKAPQATRSFVVCGQDGPGQAAIASFQPFFPGLQQAKPLNLAIVIDCSGSMGGDSMEQAKLALEEIFDGLQGHDRMSLIAFGNETKNLSDRPLACNKTNLAKARKFAKALDADMGGTEIDGALKAAYAVAGRDGPADIFLVTDGEVSDWERVVSDARRSGHRIFTVGVGSAVSEAFVRELAAATGGVCELVSPREGMSDRVVRHFERMRAPRAKHVAIRWPAGALNVTPDQIGAVFEGDTVVACAQFQGTPVHGAAVLEVETDLGETFRQELVFPAPTPVADEVGLSLVARVAATARLKEQGNVVGLDTALHYRLVSPWTNWLVVAPLPEEQQAQDLPALRKVPQTLAAGWGGSGSVMYCCIDMGSDAEATQSRASPSLELLEIPKWLTESANRLDELPREHRRLVEYILADAAQLEGSGALHLLEQSGLISEFADLFQHADHLGLSIDVIAQVVLSRLLNGPLRAYLHGDAHVDLGPLVELCGKSTEALRELGSLGQALARQMHQPTVRELLRRGPNDESLERLAGLSGFLRHMDESVEHSNQRIKQYMARGPQSEPMTVGG